MISQPKYLAPSNIVDTLFRAHNDVTSTALFKTPPQPRPAPRKKVLKEALSIV